MWSNRQPIEVRRLVYNEYFYHSGNYLKQYQLGLKHLRPGYNGHFSAGVGSSCYAVELFKQGKLRLAKNYAKKSLRHWRYYKKNALSVGGMFYVMALLVSGDESEAKAQFLKLKKSDRFGRGKHKGYYRKYGWISELSI